MNVLLATPWDARTGGVTHVAVSLAASLQQRGHRVTFLFPAETGFRIEQGTSLRGFPSVTSRLRGLPCRGSSLRASLSWHSALATALPQLLGYCLLHRINLINIHYPDESFALLVPLARILRVPLVVSAHGSDLLADAGPRQGPGLLLQLEHASAVAVPSRDYLRNVVNAYPTVRNKILCVYNGFDEEELHSSEGTQADVHKGEVTLLCIAALIPKKGIDVLLQALNRCKTTSLRLRVIGEGPLRQQLESLCGALGLADRVVFLGSRTREEVFREIRGSDFLVMPSRHHSESFGLAALEAMACGKPVVASAVGGLPEVVSHRETGLLVAPEDSDALAAAIDLLACDSFLRASLGAAGQAKAKRFTTRDCADAYEALFTELIRRPQRQPDPRAAG